MAMATAKVEGRTWPTRFLSFAGAVVVAVAVTVTVSVAPLAIVENRAQIAILVGYNRSASDFTPLN